MKEEGVVVQRTLILLSLLGMLSGCRGWTTDQPPVHVNPNMDTQLKYKAYRESDFFADKRDMRPLVEGVVSRGHLKDDDHFYRGMNGDQVAVELPPSITVNKEFMERGRERFNIYCAPCHSQVGDGDGLVGRRMAVKPTTFYSDYMYGNPIGHYFKVISDGIRTMPAYKNQIPEKDRWAIAAYIRALQISQKPDLKLLSASAK